MLNYITYTHYTHCADYINYTNYTHYFAGSFGSRNCWSRLAGQVHSHCPVCWWIEWPIQTCNACWLDEVHPSDLSGWGGCSNGRRWRGHFGAWWWWMSPGYPLVDVPNGQFPGMNTHPNCNFEIWNNQYNSTNNWDNRDIMGIIGLKQHRLDRFDSFHLD